MAATWHSKSIAPRLKVTRSPGRTLCEGRTRAPLTCTLPPLTASAASDRDLNRRTPKSQRSMRAAPGPLSESCGSWLRLIRGSGDLAAGLDDRAAGIEATPIAQLLRTADVPDDEIGSLAHRQRAAVLVHSQGARRVPGDPRQGLLARQPEEPGGHAHGEKQRAAGRRPRVAVGGDRHGRAGGAQLGNGRLALLGQ